MEAVLTNGVGCITLGKEALYRTFRKGEGKPIRRYIRNIRTQRLLQMISND
jgi:hypothetical protein